MTMGQHLICQMFICNIIKKVFLIVFVLYVLGCAGPAAYNDQPDGFRRAEVLSKNQYGITIEHSTWGKKIMLHRFTRTR